MSTRCQILFKFQDGEVLTYRHSDGYPKGVLPDLVGFLKWNLGRNNDPTYTVANYFFWNKKRYSKYLDGGRLGYGLDYKGELHGDIDYFYRVDFIEHPFYTIGFRISVYKVDDPEDINTPKDLIENSEPIQVILIEDIKSFKLSEEARA